jgi:hypothetical protein
MRSENATGNAKAQHEGVLRGCDVEEAEVFEAETIVVGGRLVLVAVLKDLVPDREWILLILPAFFSGELGDGGVEPGWFCVDCGVVEQSGCGVAGDEALGGVADEGHETALPDTGEEAMQVLLLLLGELCRIYCADAHPKDSLRDCSGTQCRPERLRVRLSEKLQRTGRTSQKAWKHSNAANQDSTVLIKELGII